MTSQLPIDVCRMLNEVLTKAKSSQKSVPASAVVSVFPSCSARLMRGRKDWRSLSVMLRTCCSLAVLAVTFTGRPTASTTDADTQQHRTTIQCNNNNNNSQHIHQEFIIRSSAHKIHPSFTLVICST